MQQEIQLKKTIKIFRWILAVPCIVSFVILITITFSISIIIGIVLYSILGKELIRRMQLNKFNFYFNNK